MDQKGQKGPKMAHFISLEPVTVEGPLTSQNDRKNRVSIEDLQENYFRTTGSPNFGEKTVKIWENVQILYLLNE